MSSIALNCYNRDAYWFKIVAVKTGCIFFDVFDILISPYENEFNQNLRKRKFSILKLIGSINELFIWVNNIWCFQNMMLDKKNCLIQYVNDVNKYILLLYSNFTKSIGPISASKMNH